MHFLPFDQPQNDLGVQRNNPPLQTAISVSKYRCYLNNFWNTLSSKLHLCSEISIRTRREKILKRLKRRVMLFKTSNNSLFIHFIFLRFDRWSTDWTVYCFFCRKMLEKMFSCFYWWVVKVLQLSVLSDGKQLIFKYSFSKSNQIVE